MPTRSHLPPRTGTGRFLQVVMAVFVVGSFVIWTLPAPDLPSYDLRRLLQIALLAAVAGWLAVDAHARTSLADAFEEIPVTARWALGSAIATGLVSAALSDRPLVGLREVSLVLLLVSFALVVAGADRRWDGSVGRSVLDAVVVAAVAYVGTYVLLTVVPGSGTSLPGFEHPRLFNHVQVILLPLLVGACVSRSWPRWQRLLLWTVLAGWWHLLFFSGGRAALLAVVLGITTGGVLLGRRAVPWVMTYVLSGVAGGAIYAATVADAAAPGSAYGVGNAIERGVTATGREHLWGLATSYLRDRPLVGIGPGHYAHEDYVAGYAASPHNLVLQFAAEWGLLATVLLLSVAVWGLVAWFRHVRNSGGRPTDAALTAAIVGVGVDAMFGGSVNDPTAGILAAAVVGLALARSAGRRRHDHRRAADVVASVLAVAALCLVVSATLTYRSPAEESGSLIRPRFWLNGVVTERGS